MTHTSNVCIALIARACNIALRFSVSAPEEAIEMQDKWLQDVERKFYLTEDIYEKLDLPHGENITQDALCQAVRGDDFWASIKMRLPPDAARNAIVVAFAEKVFKDIDVNMDGTLSPDEMIGFFKNRHQTLLEAKKREKEMRRALQRLNGGVETPYMLAQLQKTKMIEELVQKGKACPELLDEPKFLALFPKQQGASADAATAGAAAAPPPKREGKTGRPGAAERRNWVDSYAPTNFGDLVGNASSVRKLSEWLRDWDDVVLRGKTKRPAFKPGGGMPENINARAVLVSGPPGIGKTTSCHLVAKMHGGYEVLEYNASDARGQKVIQEMAAGIADNRTLGFGSSPAVKRIPGLTKRAIIIMDEVDGMGAGDRGGNAALIKMIKKARNPIICICNDSQNPKIRSLAFSCYDVKFSRPTKATVAQRCAQIAAAEGMQVEQNALEELAESCGSDMRMILNQLQMLTSSQVYKDRSLKYMDMKGELSQYSKDMSIMLTPFDAAKKLLNSFEASRLTFRQRMDMFFVDYSLVGMLVQENYLRAVEKKTPDVEVMQRCAYSADLFTIGDIMNRKIRDDQNWSLLPDMGLVGCVFPAHITNGFIAFPNFPSFLGKYSTMTRTRRLATELQTILRLSSTVNCRQLATSGYTDLLYKRLMDPLMSGDLDGVSRTVGVLDKHGLRKDHLIEHLTDLRQHLGGEDLFKIVDPKVKAAMTREFNSGSHAIKVNLPTKKRKAGEKEPTGEEEDDDELAAGAAAAEEEEEKAKGDKSDDEGGSMIKLKKAKAKAKAKGKAEPAGSPKAARGKKR
eukprot:NODE_448_length_3040_cov_8.023687.p1 GENE.NODE_448_length_3040_cov_8.023687~~NODE_448_length_3040_cov_8.023687.p1  ORF type:complete len:918 (+),score=340.15 NODE_448_length_3040_cov_8.023687:357-2756(+)